MKQDKEAFKVFVTDDYDRFKMLTDNRDLNEAHVHRLADSFRTNHLVCPIIVNDSYQVIDGQHRLAASKKTGKPVYYMVIPNYGIEQVRILNTNQKNWTKLDYLEMYAAQGVPAYVELKRFMNDFPEFGIKSSERIVSLRSSASNSDRGAKNITMKKFELGKLQIPNITKSYIYARKLMEFKPFYTHFYNGTFVSAMIPLFSNKLYDHKEMIHKLGTCPIKLTDCINIEAYRMLIEDIYNYRRREAKVSFKYA